MRYRFDGFTAEKRKRFLKALGKSGCVSDAARVAGISRNTANRWRRKEADFGRQCEAAIDMAASELEPIAWERAVTGIEEPVWYYGKQVGTRLKRSDSLLRLLLIASNKKKYGRMGAVASKQAEREMRERIEREVWAEFKAKYRVASNAEVREALNKALAAYRMRQVEARRIAGEGSGE